MKSCELVVKEKTKEILNKINSKYILKIVLENLEKKKLLDIIKYNKNIKKLWISISIIIKNIQKNIHQLK